MPKTNEQKKAELDKIHSGTPLEITEPQKQENLDYEKDLIPKDVEASSGHGTSHG